MKIIKIFQPKNVIFTAVKNRCMLLGHVFVMRTVPMHKITVIHTVDTEVWLRMSHKCQVCITN